MTISPTQLHDELRRHGCKVEEYDGTYDTPCPVCGESNVTFPTQDPDDIARPVCLNQCEPKAIFAAWSLNGQEQGAQKPRKVKNAAIVAVAAHISPKVKDPNARVGSKYPRLHMEPSNWANVGAAISPPPLSRNADRKASCP